MQIIRGPVQTAQRVVIYGPEGIGKSTLASKFPNPLFIDTEGSTRQLDVARLPDPSSWTMLLQQVDYVVNNPTVCDTLIVDTADWAERLATEAVLSKHQKTGIEDFGYGRGYVYVAEEFGRLLNRLNDVIERGIHVVLTAHAHARKFEEPGEAGSYDRWELKLDRRNSPLLKEWADMVLFANYKLYVVNVDGKGAQKGRNIAEGGHRVLHTTHHPAWDAKNRHGLADELDMDFASIAHCFPEREELAPPVATAPAPTPTPAAAPEAESAPKAKPQAPAEPSGGPFDEPAEEQPTADDLGAAGVPPALADLMRTNSVTLDELQAAVAHRGYFPPDTPFANYPPDFIDGVLIAAWPQVLELIENEVRTPF